MTCRKKKDKKAESNGTRQGWAMALSLAKTARTTSLTTQKSRWKDFAS